MGVLPKGQRWPNSCTPAILAANARLQAYARANPDWLTCLDVGDQFLTHQVPPPVEDKEALRSPVQPLHAVQTISDWQWAWCHACS